MATLPLCYHAEFPQLMHEQAERPGSFRQAAERLARNVADATANSPNEDTLRHEIENALERECQRLGIMWTPYQLERTLRNQEGRIGFADVVHGAVIIEYEPPSSFRGRSGPELEHAKEQAEDYANRMAWQEGRPISEYVLVAWDGAHLSLGHKDQQHANWERLEPFSAEVAERLLGLLRDQGQPLVHPELLRQHVGPESALGAQLLPQLFQAVLASSSAQPATKTTLLYKEWRRLFGQAVGVTTERLDEFLRRQAAAHATRYEADIPGYLFALHTYIAIVAKLVAALALPHPAQNIADANVPLRQRLGNLENGRLFVDAGIANMLSGDFFSWYIDDPAWSQIEPAFNAVISRLRGISFDVTRKAPESIRDLFKGMYEVFVPRELRHALGEVYTPDWLAEHALNQLGWQPENELLDPTCGTGTFVLEALKRRLANASGNGGQVTAEQALTGLYGIDLNPLAVLAAKVSIAVMMAPKFNGALPVVLPIYLADAINSANETPDGFFTHDLQTELGVKRFEIPAPLARSGRLLPIFDRIRVLVTAGTAAAAIMEDLQPELSPFGFPSETIQRFRSTVQSIVDLHAEHWDGIWCAILADRFAAGAICPLSHIAGNPPWVKWSHLPPTYAEFIKPMCQAMNVFSEDRYVGGIESDISTVITFQAIRKWLAPGGRLGFFITATVFSNESSQGFRRFEEDDGTPIAAVLRVEDFKRLAPFEGVTNHPSLLVVEQGRRTDYPIPYLIWSPGTNVAAGQQFKNAAQFVDLCNQTELLAKPVPGTDSGPWLKGTAEQQTVWDTLFDASLQSHYRARKGITTDLNGAYFVRVAREGPGLLRIQNDPDIGRNREIPRIEQVIEDVHVFPLMRGRGLHPFVATPDPDFKVIVPQRGMHGDPSLPLSATRTFEYFRMFEPQLLNRGSYRRYQQGQPFWSTWSTGPYTFTPYKVLWKEMGGHKFCAAYVGPIDDPTLGVKIVVPDHKLYFVPVGTLDEARYLTGILNAPTIAGAIAAYAAQLSLGVSVIENLKLPAFDPDDGQHEELARMAGEITDRNGASNEEQLRRLDELARSVVSQHQ
jgi:hypothetical protein